MLWEISYHHHHYVTRDLSTMLQGKKSTWIYKEFTTLYKEAPGILPNPKLRRTDLKEVILSNPAHVAEDMKPLKLRRQVYELLWNLTGISATFLRKPLVKFKSDAYNLKSNLAASRLIKIWWFEFLFFSGSWPTTNIPYSTSSGAHIMTALWVHY